MKCIVAVLFIWLQSVQCDDVFTNSFVVQIREGSDPHSIAKRNGYEYKGQVRVLLKTTAYASNYVMTLENV